MAETPTSIATAERRTPVVHIDSDGLHPKDAEGQWTRLSEAIRQDLTTQPQTRSVIASLIAIPVSESLPKQAVDILVQVDKRIGRLMGRYHNKLGVLLDLPPVPDEQIIPDIVYAQRLQTIADIKRGITSFGHTEGSPKFEEYLQDDILRAEEFGWFSKGITIQERDLIAQRYRFARDVKILSLGAEILEQPEGSVKFDEAGKIQLPSGVQIAVDTNQAAQRSDLLNPLLWEKKRQLKDRVYKIEVNGRRYILKEKKTPRHTDTKKGGHINGLTSEEEFSTARYFQENGTVEEGRIALRWERPIGFVTYPDGYQFSIFEYEENLTSVGFLTEASKNLTKQIIAHQNEFQTEFVAVKEAAPRYKDGIKAEFDEEKMYQQIDKDAQKRLSSVRAKLGKLMRRPITVATREEIENQLTFEQFAQLKATLMIREAIMLYRKTLYENNYTNSDSDGTAYRIKTENGLQLEITGFDFEYFIKISSDDAAERLDHLTKATKEYDWALRPLYGDKHRRIEKAAYRAMLAMTGKVPENTLGLKSL